jgi:hypothetical protein
MREEHRWMVFKSEVLWKIPEPEREKATTGLKKST